MFLTSLKSFQVISLSIRRVVNIVLSWNLLPIKRYQREEEDKTNEEVLWRMVWFKDSFPFSFFVLIFLPMFFSFVLFTDPDFLKFVEQLQAPKEARQSAEQQLEKRLAEERDLIGSFLLHLPQTLQPLKLIPIFFFFFLLPAASGGVMPPILTPLIEDLRAKRHAKQRMVCCSPYCGCKVLTKFITHSSSLSFVLFSGKRFLEKRCRAHSTWRTSTKEGTRTTWWQGERKGTERQSQRTQRTPRRCYYCLPPSKATVCGGIARC
jgi:hypothetical protein